MLKSDGIYFAYLRKSREDRDAERNGAEDTLARHEYIIKDMVKRYNIHITKWYREVVSGETIADRPQMITLLNDVENIRPDGVLVVEVERLSRGNPQDQGRVMDTFKYSGTLIITPMKIYDLNKENDEEWIDFGLLRSRMEYRTIKRRLQNGRTTSAMQGKYIGNTPPYGWKREKLTGEKGYTLVSDSDTGWILKLIYQLLHTGNADTNFLPVGITTVAHMLDHMGITPPKGIRWDAGTIARIAKNPANIGMVRIGYRKEVTTIVNGERKKSRPINKDAILVPARWKGQIDPVVFNAVCAKLQNNTRIDTFRNISNPMAGLIRCSICGRSMTKRPRGKSQPRDMIICTTYQCPTVGSYYDLIEDRLISILEQYLADYRLHIGKENGLDWTSSIQQKDAKLCDLTTRQNKLNAQLEKVCSLFEQDIYDLDTYLSRSHTIKKDLTDIQQNITTIKADITNIERQIAAESNFVPHFESVLESYKKSDDPKYKNMLLKEIVSSVDYTKTIRGGRCGKNNEAFELDVHINLMEHPGNP